ncbi:MAG: nodulation protein NfeD [Azoarcus sp.]|nr:nodulation protein NfeD [Azoarcus sp.]
MPNALRRYGACLLVLLALVMLGATAAQEREQASHVLEIPVEGAIGPASADFVVDRLERAAASGAGLVILRMDTPGGLDTSMRAMIRAILASPVPVATWVGPDGARAASAGTFILYASHIAAMSPATNLGAASPVAIGAPGPGSTPAPQEEPDGNGKEKVAEDDAEAPQRGSGTPSGDTLKDKATNDAAAYIRSLAELRGRDADFAERAVREAASLSASEALEAGAIDLIARNVDELLEKIDGREIELDSGNVVTLATAGASVERQQPDWKHRVLAVLANPQIAVVLMMIGIYGLFFEFTSPGFGVPGVAGAICIVVAMYAFQLLPINWAGVALLAFGAILMLAEAFMPSFGVLGVGGVIAFVVGGLFLVDTEAPGFGIPLSFIVGMALLSAALLFVIGTFAVKARARRVVSGAEQLVGARGDVIDDENGWHARIHGERWRVRSNSTLAPGQSVRVTAIDGLTLEVEPVTPNTEPHRSHS